MTTQEILREIASLPVEERALIADSVLRSLNPPESEIDAQWAEVASRRLAEWRLGQVAAVSGKRVFEELWKRFS